jgi:hypothetical protein
MRDGTHDYHKSWAGKLEYLKAARNTGIPIRMDISYRSGHNQIAEWTWDSTVLNALTAVIDNREIELDTATRYYKRTLSASPQGQYIQFQPERKGFFLEAPLLTVRGQKAFMCVSGEPLANFRIDIWKVRKYRTIQADSTGKVDTVFNVDEIEKKAEIPGVVGENGFTLIENVYIPSAWTATYVPVRPVTDITDTTCYLYRFYFRMPTDLAYTEVDNSNISQPNMYGRALFYLADSEPVISGDRFITRYGQYLMSYGLSEY